jgi:hypothetical protein
MYNKIIHYGCSFTYGVDSGGDGIDDPTKSYPAYLSKKTNIPFLNRANPGASLNQIALKIHEDLQNPASEIQDKNILVIVNLTDVFRMISSTCDWWPSTVNGHKLSVCNINATTQFKISSGLDAALNSLINEQEWVFYYYAYNIINSIHYQLVTANKKFVFVDMLTDITALEQYFKLSVDIKNKILTNDVNTFKNFSSFVRFNQLSPTYYSHDGHYSSKGYKLLADLVLCKLQEMSVL